MRSLFKRIKLLIVSMFLSSLLFSQENTEQSIKWGFEYDLMAPRIGQWKSVNLNGYVGYGRFKHSLLFAHIEINNNHLTDESFQKDIVTAFGYRGEIYSHREMKRWSTGIILLYSHDEVVTSINQQEGKFNSFHIGFPLGYTWVLWKHLTINPGINILFPLNNQTVKIGIDEVTQAPWGFEPGLRIGYRF